MEVTYEEMLGLIYHLNKPRWRQRLEDFINRAGSKSNYLSKKLLDLPLSATAFSAATPIYAALWTATLDDTSTGATAGEAAYTSYARVSITNNATNFPNATGTTTATKSNANAFTWPASTGSTATITFMCLVDSSSGAGNIYYWCSVTSTPVNLGDTPQTNASAFTVVED